MRPTNSDYTATAGVAHEPVSASVLWPDVANGPWRITLWWRVQYGIPTPVGMAITSWQNEIPGEIRAQNYERLPAGADAVPLPELTGLALRALPLTELKAQTRRIASEFLASQAGFLQGFADRAAPGAPLAKRVAAGEGPAAEQAVRASCRYAEQADALRRRRSTRDLGDDYYREVAEVYAAAVRGGAAPTKAVREKWRLTPSAAAKQVARARERGFLPPSSGRGRVGRIDEAP